MHPQQTTKPDPMNGYTHPEDGYAPPVGANAPPTSHETRPKGRICTPGGEIDPTGPLPRRVLTNLRVYAAAGNLLANGRRVSEVSTVIQSAADPPAS